MKRRKLTAALHHAALSAVTEKMAADKAFCSDYLGGQNPYGYYNTAAKSISAANVTRYDNDITEMFEAYMNNRLRGDVPVEDAYLLFADRVKAAYPELTVSIP